MTDVLPAVDLADPATFIDGPPHEALEQLRRHDPVHWQPMRDQPGFWAVLRHADVEYVARETSTFSAERGGIVIEDLPADSLEMLRGTLLSMDPPRHRVYRRALVRDFGLRAVSGLEEQVRAVCRDILDEVEPGATVEFAADVAGKLPTRVIGRMMGVPREDWDRLHILAEYNTRGDDPEVRRQRAQRGDSEVDGTTEMAMYAIAFATRRRSEPPRQDWTSLLLAADVGEGRPMSEIEFGKLFVQLVTAGNDTTQTMLSSGLLALLAHPEQLAALRARPELIPGAIEEILRWANPLHYFRRTATRDVELSGASIRAGDKVAMYYTAANRDPEVFPDPHRFDITRSPNRHLSFGIAEHFCLGVHLARLEGRVFFEELLARFPRIELAGDPVRVVSNLNNGLSRLPVRLG